MHGALVRDAEEGGALVVVEVAGDDDAALEVVDERSSSFYAGVAVLGVGLGVADLHCDAVERKSFAVGVEPERHRRACSERRAEEVVRRWAGVEAADVDRFVREEAVIADHDVVQEGSLSGLGHHHWRARARRRCGRVLIDEESLRPARDHPCGVDGVIWSGQEVVRSVEGEKALGVPRSGVDPRRVVDANDVVSGGMRDKERRMELTGSFLDRMR